MAKKSRYSKLKRTREIVSIFIAYGFSDFISETPILKLVGRRLGKITPKRKGINLSDYTRSERIRFAFEDLGTTFIKLGQILSSRHDVLPKDITEELSKLQDSVEPFDEKESVKIIERDLGKTIDELFKSFECTPTASASISQVHKAVLNTGETVAIKVKRPNIDDKIIIDIEIITWISGVLEKYIEDIALLNPQKILKAFKTQLMQELDLSFEKNNISRFYKYFEKNENIKIPKTYDEYSTKNVLTMEYVNGIKISDIKDYKEKLDGKVIISRIADCMLEQVFMLGFFHADPHPGNILAMENNIVCFLDFGMIGYVPPITKTSLATLITSLSSGDYTRFSRTVLDMCETREIENMEEFDSTMYIFVSRYVDMPISEINLEEIFNEIISIIREFRLALSSNIMMMIKSLIVLEGVGRVLDKDFTVIEHIKPFASKYLKDQMKPKSLFKQLKGLMVDYHNILKNMPSDLSDLITVMKKGGMKIQLEHRRLEVLASTLDKLADRLSYSIVLASLIISSALIVNAKIPPLFHGIPIIGMIGFAVSAIMGFAMLISRFFKNYIGKNKNNKQQ